MQFSRTNPSPRYQALLGMYRDMHANGESFLGIVPEDTFPGQSLPPHARTIQRVLRHCNARTVLDYGSGKGRQYLPMTVTDAAGRTYASIPAMWDAEVTCYDPAYPPHATLPEKRFDAVVCTDVLEHVPEEDAPWIVGELFGMAEKCVYANVASYPASKRLPNGENAHATIRTADWWEALFRTQSQARGEIPWFLQIETKKRQFGFFGKKMLSSQDRGPLAS